MLHAPNLNLVQTVAESILGNITQIERVPEGVSTWVYRIRYKGEILYLRILPEESSFAVEAQVHDVLHGLGVHVPQIVHFEERNSIIPKSVMITKAIHGHSLQGESDPAILRTVLRSAGREIALINSVPVQGFGWIDRNSPKRLCGEQPSFTAFYAADLADGVNRLPTLGMPVHVCASIRSAMDAFLAQMSGKEARLVHGDLDTTHIFCSNGLYTGLIDFGEIMGNYPLYDLALFHFYSDLPRETDAFAALLEGYREITPIDQYDQDALHHLALLFGVWKISQQDRKAVRKEAFIATLVERVQRQMQLIMQA